MINLFLFLLGAKILLVSLSGIVGVLFPPLFVLLSLLVMYENKYLSVIKKERFLLYFILIDSMLLFSIIISQLHDFPLVPSLVDYFKVLTSQALFILGGYVAFVEKNERRFFRFIMFLAFVHIVAGIISPVIGIGKEVDGIVRYAGLAGKINILANFALFFSVFYFVLFKYDNKSLYFLLFFMATFCVVLTGTMKNLLVLIVIISFLWVKESRYKTVSIIMLFLVFFPTLVYFVTSSSIFDRVDEFLNYGINLDVAAGDKVGNSMNWRILHWKFLLSDWYQNYFWFGSGIGHYDQLNGIKTDANVTFDPHNDYIKFLIEYGAIFFVGFVSFLFKLGLELYILGEECEYSKALFYSFIASMVAMFAGQLVFSLVFFYFFWPMFGFLLVRNRILKDG
ncbi:putative Lipid A core, O-antigen ligase family enzyme [Vibrio chagasii]|uniref:O-antigen ligase family protein n=1 Tax=Vibrio chagasii TaxID=170679 RepID=UPI003385C55B|nr:putative Lipid A core, O-antigen ligase family enzyme [Vibrio chagasii]CAH7101389.1 putative Lipid A core, O-antigen ligase family enzyme [Vibrio chagasii]CAH7117471.1 putative Lipid A core, O-antigen ligase family enzyme [Vibrio chagasii]CAH7329807.1 putative Lipid A core, O-antigen ligase family enzyme [Vibrio chagasii]